MTPDCLVCSACARGTRTGRLAQWRLRHIRLQLRVASLRYPRAKQSAAPASPQSGLSLPEGTSFSREERAVKTRLAICLAVAAISAAVLPMSASAQALLPPYEITTSVRSMGLVPISPPVRRGARYVLRAIDGRGAEVTVAADALSGRILSVRLRGYGGGAVYAGRFY